MSRTGFRRLVGLPALTERLEAGPAVVWTELDAEEVPELAVEVGDTGLRTSEHPDRDLGQLGESFLDDAQRDGLAVSWLSGAEGKAPVVDHGLDARHEALDARCGVESFVRDVRSERVPLEAIETEKLLSVHQVVLSSSVLLWSSSPSRLPSSFGR